MKAENYLEKNKDSFVYYNEIKKIIDDLKEHRGNFGKIFEYCHKNSNILNLCLFELLEVIRDDETYCVLHRLLNSDNEKKENSTPYFVDESNVVERYYANLIRERETDDLHTFEWWQQLEKQARQAIELEQQKNAQKTTFSDYLYHNNKPALMEKLCELLSFKDSGRDVAKVLLALEKKNYLLRKSYTVNEVIAEFNLLCSRQSITTFTSENAAKPIPQSEIQQIIDLLP